MLVEGNGNFFRIATVPAIFCQADFLDRGSVIEGGKRCAITHIICGRTAEDSLIVRRRTMLNLNWLSER